jgi:uncharacterized membrane protein (DUF373 family)
VPGLDNHDSDPILRGSRVLVRLAVRALTVLMTLLILIGTVDVAWTLYDKIISAKPVFILDISVILATFGAFMAVLIAIEILINIRMYLRDEVIHVPIVLATAVMAIARKVIIMDYEKTEPEYVWATAAVLLAASAGYWLLCKSEPDAKHA